MSLDMTMILLNRENYKANIQTPKTRVKFTSEEKTHGHMDIISIADLLGSRPRYTDANGEFLLEISLSNIQTLVKKEFLIQPSFFKTTSGKASQAKQLISGEFSFCSFSWSILVCPEPLDLSDKVCVSLQRRRSTKENINYMLAQLKYRFFCDSGNSKNFSPWYKEVFTCEEEGTKWTPSLMVSQLFRNNLQV